MAQGAATAIEDGAFLGRVLREVVSGHLTLPEVIPIYEKSRMPKAHSKQRISFLNGYIWHLPDGQAARNRDKVTEVEPWGATDAVTEFVRRPGDCVRCVRIRR